MGFGMKVKVEAPKVEVPKVDVAGAVDGVKDSVSGAVDSAKSAVSDAVDSAKDAVNGAVEAATDAVNDVKESLSSVAGAIADVAVSFTGAIEDIALEPHLQLDANASYAKTNFEKGPLRIRMEMTPEEALASNVNVRLFTESGNYDEIRPVKDFQDENGVTVVLIFEEVPMGEYFSLKTIDDNGVSNLIFRNVQYGNLRKTKQRYL